jgi:hypothetical protein
MTRTHRRKRPKPSARELALLSWLELNMADPVAARLALRVVGMHAGLIRWIHEAEQAMLTPAPQRRHPFDARDTNRGAHISGTRDPDTWIINAVDQWMLYDHDPEHLEPVRYKMTHKLGEMAGWYVDKTGVHPRHPEVLPRWEPLAIRLGDLIGDQVAANVLATSILGHHALAITALNPSRGMCQNGREQWRRRAVWYVETALDQQPERRHDRPRVESVGPDGERQIG